MLSKEGGVKASCKGVKGICADNLNELRTLGLRVAGIEEGLSGLFTQMSDIREMVANFMHNYKVDRETSTLGGNGLENIQETPRSRPTSGDMFSPEDFPPTPLGIMRPPGASSLPFDTASSLPGSSFRELRYAAKTSILQPRLMRR